MELAPLPSPGFYSHLFVVWKTSGSWRPVIDLSTLNRFVDVSHFQMETIQFVLLSIRQGDWMASIDLREAYLHVPVHPESRPFLRFVSDGQVYQFKVLCFGLSTAPQAFSRVMAPVSAILHSMGIRMLRYLDDWLVQSSSQESLLRDLRVVLSLCHELGIVVNPEKSNLVSSQVVQYLGVVINAQSFVASPSPDRISRLLSTAGEFHSSASPPASVWLSLLGMLSSLAHLVPGGRLRMRSLQLCLHKSWDRVDLLTPVAWSSECLQDLQWWLHLPRLSQGVSLRQVSPDLDIWSDASDVGWGAHLGPLVASGLWDLEQESLSINARELLAIRHGLLHFQSSLCGKTVAVFCDNVTAVAYLRKAGGTRSPLLNTIAQGILRWAESLAIRLAPQFIPGSNNVLADTLSRPHELPHSEWSLNMTVFRSLSRQWPVQIDFSRIRRNLFIHKARIPARRFSSSMYQHFKMFPPFASNEGYSASGLRYQSDGVRVTHPLPHSEFTRLRERTCDLTLALSHSPFAYYSYISLYSHLFLTSTVILLLCDHRVRIFQQCFVDADRLIRILDFRCLVLPTLKWPPSIRPRSPRK